MRYIFQIMMLLLISCSNSNKTDSFSWPQWRGSNQDGISLETGILTSWPENGPREIWRAPAGEGYSGISVQNGRLYTQYADSTDEFLVCLNAGNGTEIWRVQTDSLFKNEWGNGSRSTPAIDDGVVYALSPHGKLFAVDAIAGTTIWYRDLVGEYNARVPYWGVSTSPVVNREMLIINNCGANGHGVIALNKATAELIWKSETETDSYSTPIIVEIGGVEQAVVFKADALISVATKDGARLWEFPWKSNMGQCNATPIFQSPDKIFISSYSESMSALLQISADVDQFTVNTLWHYNKMWNHHSTAILIGGYIYGFHAQNILKCLNIKTHEEKWVKRGFGHGSLTYADGHFFVLGEKGQLALIEATPRNYVEKSQVQILGKKCWTVPTLSNGYLYIRDESVIICLDVKNRTQTLNLSSFLTGSGNSLVNR